MSACKADFSVHGSRLSLSAYGSALETDAGGFEISVMSARGTLCIELFNASETMPSWKISATSSAFSFSSLMQGSSGFKLPRFLELLVLEPVISQSFPTGDR
ncbi:hypothetical protein ACFX1T_005627 [Malus domestica]